MTKGIGIAGGFAGGMVCGTYVAGIILMLVGMAEAGTTLIAGAMIAHAIRDHGSE
jgi:hypothetical protein